MRFASHASLDQPLAWQRTKQWGRGLSADLPDRLPFTVDERIFGDAGPPLYAEHHLAPVTLVMATKGAGTLRPFTRIEVRDFVMYEALVDALAPQIDQVLARHPGTWSRPCAGEVRARVHPLAIAPWWSNFLQQVRRDLEIPPSPFAGRQSMIRYVLSADVAGYYLHIDVERLERILLAHGMPPDVCGDLRSLLLSWHALGLRGLPQGIPPSAPLANFFLIGLDGLLEAHKIRYRRFMDDLRIYATSYRDARAAQHLIEEYLYELGMTLASDKLSITNRQRALDDLPVEGDKVDLLSILEGRPIVKADYDGTPAEGDVDADSEGEREAKLEEAWEAYAVIRERHGHGQTPPNVRIALREILDRLADALDDEILDDIEELVRRYPDMVLPLMRYAAALAHHPPARRHAEAVFQAVVARVSYLRDQERAHVCVAATAMPNRALPVLAQAFAQLATEDRHPVVRARALLAWGILGGNRDLEPAQRFMEAATPEYRAYPVVAIQRRAVRYRDPVYRGWSRVSGDMRTLIESVQRSRIPWEEC
jgi:hypothetical protein